MRRFKNYLFLLLVIWPVMSLRTQSIPNDTTIARWYNDKKMAYTLVFDDGTSSQFYKILPTLKKYNLKATFFIIPFRIQEHHTDSTSLWYNMNWDIIRTAVNEGHEIGSHTYSHRILTDPKVDVDKELRISKKMIEKEIPGYQCLTLAYPYNTYNDSVIKIAKKYYIAARTESHGNITEPVQNFYAIGGIMPNGISWTKKAVESYFSNAIYYDSWEVDIIHEIGKDRRNGVLYLDSSTFYGHLDRIMQFNYDIWNATFVDVIKYVKERQSAYFLKDIVDNNTFSIVVKTDLPDSIYNHPLTIFFNLPEGWKGLKVFCNSTKRTYQAFTNNGIQIMVNVIPNTEKLIIEKADDIIWNDVVYINNAIDFKISYQNGSIKLFSNTNRVYNCNIVICDMLGRVIKNEANKIIDNNSFFLNIGYIKPDLYVIKIEYMEGNRLVINSQKIYL
jgi:oligosaccharide reducing-end xylanase